LQESAAPDIFRYWHGERDGEHYYAMCFWDAFLYCTMFNDPRTS
jgi:hypothetical protein